MKKPTPKKKFRPNAAMICGFIVVGFFIIVAVFAPLIAPYDPHELGIPYLKPSAEHLLGTNDVGQDILSELIYGTRISLFIGVFTALLVTFLGTLLALLAGYYRGPLDKFITGMTNVTMALPSLALTMLLIAYLNPGKASVIIAISITAWTGTARALRARVLQLCEMPFVKMERALGMPAPVILFKHIVPNLRDMILSRAALAVSSAMMTEASLSFLGLGDFGKKSWGNILHYAFYQNGVIRGYYWWYLPPILCTALSTLGFMLLGYYGGQRKEGT